MANTLNKTLDAPKATKTPYVGFLVLLMAILVPFLWTVLHTLTADTVITQRFGDLLSYAIAGFIGGLMGFINQQLSFFVEAKYKKHNANQWKIANTLCWILAVSVFFVLCFFYITQS